MSLPYCCRYCSFRLQASGGRVKTALFDCEWDNDDDSRLLRGVYEYGLGNWDALKMDDNLQLYNKVCCCWWWWWWWWYLWSHYHRHCHHHCCCIMSLLLDNLWCFFTIFRNPEILWIRITIMSLTVNWEHKMIICDIAQLVKYDVHTTRKINSMHAIFYHILSFYSAQRLDLSAWCVRLSFWTHLKSMHFHSFIHSFHVISL